MIEKKADKIYSLDKLMELYKSVGLESRNPRVLFGGLYDIFDKLYYLPSIDPKYKEILTTVKIELTVLDTLIDDLADNINLRDESLLEKALKIPWNYHDEYQNKYLEVIRNIWKNAISSIEKFPRYDEFKKLFWLDFNQFIVCVMYSDLVNTHGISNELEDRIFLPHNMMAILFCDLDIMCSPDFDNEELRYLRPILYEVQDITHIGNILSTWRREVKELDFSSPIIALGLEKGIIGRKEVETDLCGTEKKLESLIPHYLKRADEDFRKIEMRAKHVRSVDLEMFNNNLKEVFNRFLTREKYWENV